MTQFPLNNINYKPRKATKDILDKIIYKKEKTRTSYYLSKEIRDAILLLRILSGQKKK